MFLSMGLAGPNSQVISSVSRWPGPVVSGQEGGAMTRACTGSRADAGLCFRCFEDVRPWRLSV
jgi:hypothetical protein